MVAPWLASNKPQDVPASAVSGKQDAPRKENHLIYHVLIPVLQEDPTVGRADVGAWRITVRVEPACSATGLPSGEN